MYNYSENHGINRKVGLKVYTNTVKIIDKNTQNNKVKLEVSYKKNNEVFYKNVFVNNENINSILQKLQTKGFNVIDETQHQGENVAYIDNSNYGHIDKNTPMNVLGRLGYDNSFQQKYE